MPVFFCRWPNGDLSIVAAPNRAEAVVRLDEFGNADGGDVVQVGEFLADFRLTDRGELELSEFGEATYYRIMEKGYPLLCETMGSDIVMGLKENGRRYQELVRGAVQAERRRLRGQKRVKPAKTEKGRRLQHDHDLPGVKADRLTRESVKEVLESDDDGFVN
jgi:hypothetical protein